MENENFDINSITDIEFQPEENLNFEESLNHLDEVVDRIQEVESRLENYNGDADDAYYFITETTRFCSNMMGYYQESYRPRTVRKRDIALLPLMQLSYSREGLKETIIVIFKKIKEFLVLIFKQIVTWLKSIIRMLDGLTGLSKKLLDSYQEQFRGNRVILSEKKLNHIYDMLSNHYSSVIYLSSDLFSPNYRPSIYGVNLKNLYLNDLLITMPTLDEVHVGDKEKFTRSMVDFFRSSAMSKKPLFMDRMDDIQQEIINSYGYNKSSDNDNSVLIYNIDNEYVHYFVFHKESSDDLKFKVGKTKIKNFKKVAGNVNLKASDLQDVFLNDPVDFGIELLKINISNCSKDIGRFNKIPGIVRKIEKDIDARISKLSTKGVDSDLNTNLSTYSRALKELCNKYYSNTVSSRFKLYRFYYKFASYIHDACLSEKNS